LLKVVYIDVLFGMNFIINYLMLYASAKLGGQVIKRFFIALSAIVGAIYCCLTYFAEMQKITAFVAKITIGLIMVLIAFGINRNLFRLFLSFCGVSFAFGGCVLAVYYISGGAGGMIDVSNGIYYLRVSFKTLLLSAGISFLIVNFVFKRCVAKNDGRSISRVRVENQSKRVCFQALIDTGNNLTDPITNRPVIIAEYDMLREILDRKIIEVLDNVSPTDFPLVIDKLPREYKFRLLPYKTIGCEFDMLLVFQPDSIFINDRKLKDGFIALSPNRISDGGIYNAIVSAVA